MRAAARAVPLLPALRCSPYAACALPFSGEFFPGIPKIRYEGPDSTNPLAFRYYNASEEILGKPMREWCEGSTWARALVAAAAAADGVVCLNHAQSALLDRGAG